MSYDFELSPTARRALGYSIMAIAVGVLFLLLAAKFLFTLAAGTVLPDVNQTINQSMSSAAAYISQVAKNLSGTTYTDPFTSSLLGPLGGLKNFLYTVVTNQTAFFTLLALDIVLMAFDVYWLTVQPE